MAEESTSSKETASGPAPQSTTEDAYALDQLIDNAMEIFGQPPFVVEGAIAKAGLTGPTTKTDMQTAIDDFLNQVDQSHTQGG